jgi:eukaryotic-like serine/threonine-protein kinase
MALEGQQINHYRILRLLGSGGMGEVYLAEDARINQQVAMKVSRTEATAYPNTSTAQDAIRLFRREARAIARLDHPYILPLFNYGEEIVNGMTLIYIVMPYRREGSFVNWLQQRRDNELLSVQDVAHFISQAASALQYAHDNQIIHQDVKPSNFLMRSNTERPGLPDLLLADFGIARLSTATSSLSHSIRGTPAYMAPEQWSGEPVYATDQYALAIFAYELLAGRPPFVGRQEQIMYQHFSVQPEPPSRFNPQLSKDLDAVILKALAKRPEDRFSTISAFATAFQQAASGLDASTLIKTLPTPKSNDLRATLAISKAEAQTGTTRILTLPGGRQVPVSVPAGVYNGQMLRFPMPDELSSSGGPAATLILTLSVQETGEIASQTQDSTLQHTLRASPPPTSDKTTISSGRSNTSSPPVAEAPHVPSGDRHQGIPTGTAILLVGLVFLLLVGGLGFLYLSNLNHSSLSTTNSVTAPPSASTPGIAATPTPNPTPTPTATPTPTPTPIVTTPPSSYVQLKSYYSGTASGYADGAVTFTLKSEDQQGNVSMQTTFQQLPNAQKVAIYSCQGSATTDRHLTLQCSNTSDPTYELAVQGYVFPDGHMEGTETATNTNDPTYNHVYNWKAS